REGWMKRTAGNCVFIYAKTGEGIDRLKQMIYEEAKKFHIERFPYNDFLFQKYDDLGQDSSE
ncbi:MAG: GTPase HflX, partial [Paramuribaculum sp.]|nr:GTPase HflX [Paramuribaculum sp.]